ncbi:MAG: biopolymer transporter ExbD [Leptolyngbyaceae bacterium]|nr:biopolymer transporter ExbD [Leptolyngbyaceae bacterium]
MRLKNKADVPIPSVNLIPMLNVMLGILAFFVMITMTLGESQGVNVQLPARSDAPPPETDTLEEPPPPLIVRLTGEGQVLVDEVLTLRPDAEQQIQTYIDASEEGLVYITAAKSLPYEEVIQFLIEMKRIGGDRISLTLEEE